jgi:hypothetical protein
MDLLSHARSDFHALIGKREGFENLSGESTCFAFSCSFVALGLLADVIRI